MKFTLEIEKKGLSIRQEILDASGFGHDGALAVHSRENAIVVMKKEMTAMELVQAFQSLHDLTAELLIHLTKVCDPCEHCDGGCPCTKDGVRVRLPDELLERIGIPKDAKLDVIIEDNAMTIREAEGFDLRDVPPEIQELFRQAGICLDSLEELLAKGDVVYAG